MKCQSLLLLLTSLWSALGVVIQTNNGLVNGYTRISNRYATEFAAFFGIPYAKPPLGPLRFKAPEPHDNWEGTRDANQESSWCYGSEPHYINRYSEDCLYLNVYTPSWNQTNLKAVMVYIQGGALIKGSDDIKDLAPDFYMDNDVVFVTFNYRLGPLGFLSLQIREAPGNAGLKDQVMALKWVKANIRNFGGDPKKITLFGNSAGGGSVSFLQLATSTKGLYQRVIHQSGEFGSPRFQVSPSKAVDRAYALGNLLSCKIQSQCKRCRKKMYRCLMDLEASLLSFNQLASVSEEDRNRFQMYPFIPTIEPKSQCAIFTKDPHEIVASGKYVKVTTMLGTVKRDGLRFYKGLRERDPNGTWTKRDGQNMTNFIPKDLLSSINPALETEVGKRIKDFYFGGNEITLSERQHLIDLLTDTQFVLPTNRLSLIMSKTMKESIYQYEFTYDGPFSKMRQDPTLNNIEGPGHTDELGYLMNPSYSQRAYGEYNLTTLPQKMIDRMTRLWTNFAKTGNPTPVIDDVIKTNWRPFTTTQHNYLDIGEELTLKQGLASERMKFWNDIYQLVLNIRPFPE